MQSDMGTKVLGLLGSEPALPQTHCDFLHFFIYKMGLTALIFLWRGVDVRLFTVKGFESPE